MATIDDLTAIVTTLSNNNAALLTAVNVQKSFIDNAVTGSGASATAAAAALTAFYARYLGPKAVAPTLDNAGLALTVGALYWDSVALVMKSWNGTDWASYEADAVTAASSATASAATATTQAGNASASASGASASAGTATTKATEAANSAASVVRDGSGGVAGLTLFKLNMRNAANTITSWFTNANTVARTYTLPNKDGTVAMTSDITGTNSGTNTGDQSASTVVNTPAGNISATTVQASINELDTAIALKADLSYVENALSISGAINDIGVQGARGFGAGICPTLPTGFSALNGTYNKFSDNYGNYQFSDSSIMVWIPAFFYKYNADNTVAILPHSAYATVAAANTAGYALHRAFYNAGIEQAGAFVDKYACSNNGGIASSIRGKNPLSSNVAHNPFSGLTGAPPNFYYGAIAAIKTRGAKFFCNSRFIFSALAMLSLAHGQSASANTCAWYDAAGITNYPKGCNNNALGDTNDATLTFASDGYSNAAQTGSANVLAKTTHNGQGSGVADLNGGMWEINLGMTSDGANFYLLKTAADISAITGGNTLATDAWGASGIAALYDSIGATYGALTASNSNKTFGSTSQTLSGATSGTAWSATGAGIPLLAGVGGANKFGNDYMLDYRPNELCAIAGGYCSNGAYAGVWALHLLYMRGTSYYSVGCRAALYL